MIHLSDLHFGKKHRFRPPATPAGDVPSESSFPALLEKLSEDLARSDPNCPVLVCITGDFTETGSLDEFAEAERFIKGLADVPLMGKVRGLGSIFVVPGNHDVRFDGADKGTRWQQWAEFYNRIFGELVRREEPERFSKIHDRSGDLGAVVLTLNTAIYVQHGRPDEDRGRLDQADIARLEAELDSMDQSALQRSIRIAMLHHHPVLIPSLAEPGRGYDAVVNSGFLLAMLRRHGFHLILHGHKHNPHTFTDDTLSAFQTSTDQNIILIAAGGSAGSVELPTAQRPRNCYNIVTVKWNPSSRQTRVRVETRGLNVFHDDGTERLAQQWLWETIRLDDRHFVQADEAPTPRARREREFSTELDAAAEEARKAEYGRLRGNMPVVEIVTSLTPGQSYEARLWIVGHASTPAALEREEPLEVVWSAGPLFEVVSVSREDDSDFAATLSYWGPMLVQARLIFADGSEVLTHLYAREPQVYGAPVK